MSIYERLALLGAALTIAVATWRGRIALFALVAARRQSEAQLESQFFAEYTRRYQAIMTQLPGKIVNNEATLSEIGDERERDRIGGVLRAYIDLCAEEHFLWKSGRLREDVWKLWSEGILDNFKTKGLWEVWKAISSQRDYADLEQFFKGQEISWP